MSVSSQVTTLNRSYRACELLAREAGKNFYYSFLTLPRDRYRSMCALYAFMRITDDLADAGGPASDRAAALARWRAELHAAVAGPPPGGEYWPAIADMLARHQVPTRYLADVITGVEMDLGPVTIETFPELERYCYHVAGAVGLACIHVWGFHDQRAEALAIDTGTALQLTNILRDVREDAGLGRVYLPGEDLRRFGVTVADLGTSSPPAAVYDLLAFEAARAREFYARIPPLFEYLDPPGRPILRTMVDIYRGLLTKMERAGYDVFSQRVQLTRTRKLFLVARSLARHRLGQLWDSLPGRG
ncbi:MAG: phytoene/squalene synthase family protein [Planctomycetaceae bacterium]